MKSSKHWILKLGLVAVLVIAVSAPAFAAKADAARDLFNKGRDRFDDGKYSDAESIFRQVLEKHPKHELADSASYYLIRTLPKTGKTAEARSLIESFTSKYPKSRWLTDVEEYRVTLTNQVTQQDLMRLTTAMSAATRSGQSSSTSTSTSRPGAAPAAGATPGPIRTGVAPGQMTGVLATPQAPRGGRPAPDPEVTMQQEVLRVLFDTNADRAIAVSIERLVQNASDPVVLSSLHMIANSKSAAALPMLVNLAKNSPDAKARKDAIYWISQSRGEKDTIADLLVSLVPTLASDTDSESVTYALRQVNTTKSYDALATIAKDKGKSEKIRMSAIQYIGDSRVPTRLAMLDEIYKANSDSARIRSSVVNSAGQIRDAAVVPFLMNVVNNDSDLNVRRNAINQLSNVKGPEAQKALEDYLLKKKP